MKVPFDRVTANCDLCGVFTVERKPKTGKRALSTCGQDNSQWRTVVCPVCRMHAEVVKVESVV